MSQTYQHTKSNALQSENLQDSADTKDQDPTASNPDAQELSKLEAISLRVENDFRDFPVMAKIALKKMLSRQDASPAVKSAGRVGLQQGKVSELTAIATLKPGGGDHLRRILKLIGGNMDGAYDVGTVHDMRFVILANDSKILFCTAYDGDWDTYIEDFATKIPDYMDLLFANVEGWPGIHDPSVKDFIAQHQITADGWYVDSPNLTVQETRQMQKNQKALERFMDEYSKSYKKATDMTEAELRHSQEKLEDFLKSIGTGGTGLE